MPYIKNYCQAKRTSAGGILKGTPLPDLIFLRKIFDFSAKSEVEVPIFSSEAGTHNAI